MHLTVRQSTLSSVILAFSAVNLTQMKHTVKSVNQKLLDIVQNDFDSCEWFIISANELMKTVNDTIDIFKDDSKSFKEIKDSIGKIGISISDLEKCLDGVEECYSKMVESLSNEANKNKKDVIP